MCAIRLDNRYMPYHSMEMFFYEIEYDKWWSMRCGELVTICTMNEFFLSILSWKRIDDLRIYIVIQWSSMKIFVDCIFVMLRKIYDFSVINFKILSSQRIEKQTMLSHSLWTSRELAYTTHADTHKNTHSCSRFSSPIYSTISTDRWHTFLSNIRKCFWWCTDRCCLNKILENSHWNCPNVPWLCDRTLAQDRTHRHFDDDHHRRLLMWDNRLLK